MTNYKIIFNPTINNTYYALTSGKFVSTDANSNYDIETGFCTTTTNNFGSSSPNQTYLAINRTTQNDITPIITTHGGSYTLTYINNNIWNILLNTNTIFYIYLKIQTSNTGFTVNYFMIDGNSIPLCSLTFTTSYNNTSTIYATQIKIPTDPSYLFYNYGNTNTITWRYGAIISTTPLNIFNFEQSFL